jgi:hypothetical protein
LGAKGPETCTSPSALVHFNFLAHAFSGGLTAFSMITEGYGDGRESGSDRGAARPARELPQENS